MASAMRATGERRLAQLHVGPANDEELRHFILIGAIGLVVLNACDLLLTRHLLAAGAHEGNPLMAGIIEGPWGIVVKIVIPMLLALRYLTAPLYRRVAFGLGFVVVLYCGVVAWNLHVMLSHAA